MNILAPANFSEDRKYRYSLCRFWGNHPVEWCERVDCTHPASSDLHNGWTLALLIGCNPSKADEDAGDPTIGREVSFCRGFGFDGFIKCNAGGLVSTDPAGLFTSTDPIGPLNDKALMTASAFTSETVVCWGAFKKFAWRFEQVEALLRGTSNPISCFGLTKGGFPKHPLYLKATTERVPYVLG